MKIQKTKFKGLKIIKNVNYYDKRGYFREILKNKFIKNKKFIFWAMSKLTWSLSVLKSPPKRVF